MSEHRFLELLADAITKGPELGRPIAIPLDARRSYVELLNAKRAHKLAAAAHKAADHRLEAAKGALMLALVEAGLIGMDTVHKINDDGTFQIAAPDEDVKRPQPPSWVAEELDRIAKEGINGNDAA